MARVVGQFGFDAAHNLVDALVELLEQFACIEGYFHGVALLHHLVVVGLLGLQQLRNFSVHVDEFSVVFAIVQIYQHV